MTMSFEYLPKIWTPREDGKQAGEQENIMEDCKPQAEYQDHMYRKRAYINL